MEVLTRQQRRQLIEAVALDDQRFRFIARQALFEQIARQHHVHAVIHVVGRQAQFGQWLDVVRAITAFFHQFAIGGGHRVLARVDQSLGQGQHILLRASGIFADQQHVVGVGHGDDHHRAVTAALEALEAAGGAIGEGQFQRFDGEQARACDLAA